MCSWKADSMNSAQNPLFGWRCRCWGKPVPSGKVKPWTADGTRGSAQRWGEKSRIQNTKLKTNLIATVRCRSGLQLFFLNIRDVANSWPCWERCIISDVLGFNYRGFGRWYIISGNTELTEQAMYISCKIKALLHNYLCRGKAISIQYCECVCVCVLFL